MVTYTSGRREVRASKEYRCEHCNGTIFRKDLHWNYHSIDIPGWWKGRRHLDCEAAWWQGEAYTLLSAVAKLPGQNPPDIERTKLPLTAGEVVSFATAGQIAIYTPQAYRARLLFCPDQQLVEAAVAQHERVMQLCWDSLMAASGDAKKSMMVSNIVQQMALAAGIETKSTLP